MQFIKYCRLRAGGKTNANGVKKPRTRERAMRKMHAPEANAELQANLDVRLISQSTPHLLAICDHNLKIMPF